MPLDPVRYSFAPVGPVVQAADPDFLVRVVRPPAMTVVEEIIGDTDPEVPRTFDESHEEEANELGRWRFSTFDADPWNIALCDLVEFYDRGLLIGGGVVRSKQTEKVDRGSEGKRPVQWAGVRPLGVLEEATVYPTRGLGSTAQDRVWGWFGITYDDSAWGTASYVGPAEGSWPYWPAAVEDFDDTTAQRIWAARRAGNPPLQNFSPEGECLFRDTYTVPDGVSEVEVQLAGDDVIDAFHEGEPLLHSLSDSLDAPFVKARKRRVSVRPGQNLIAVAVANSADVLDEFGANQNPAFFMGAIYAIDGNGNLGDLLWHSTTAMKILEYPPSRPGVTPGLVLLELLGEAQARGCVPWVSPTFTELVDSAGRPWAEVGEIGTKVGYSLWKVCQQLISVYIDSDLTPGTNQWHAWVKDTRGRNSGVVFAPTTDPATSNLQEHTVTETLMRGNVVLSNSQFGWQQHDNSPSGRRIEATLGLGALPSFAEVDRWARAELAEDSQNLVEHDAKILPASDADKPYWSFGIGDRVTIDGSPEVVQSISWRRDRQGVIWWDEDEAG